MQVLAQNNSPLVNWGEKKIPSCVFKRVVKTYNEI